MFFAEVFPPNLRTRSTSPGPGADLLGFGLPAQFSRQVAGMFVPESSSNSGANYGDADSISDKADADAEL